jgi:hypothetical protein
MFALAALLVVLAAVGLMLAYGARRGAGGEARDLLTLIAEQAEAVRLEVRTSDPAVASEFILNEFGWPLDVPPLRSARLVGVGVHALSPEIELPVMRYVTAENTPLTVFAYDYAFLDAAEAQVRLASPLYAHLADAEAMDVRRVEGHYLVVWRRRAAIYTAVTASEPTALVEEVRSRK